SRGCDRLSGGRSQTVIPPGVILRYSGNSQQQAAIEYQEEVREMKLDQAALEAYLAKIDGAPVEIEQVRELGGTADGAAALKGFGSGRPLRIDYRLLDQAQGPPAGEPRRVVLRRVNRNGFGRERDSDRVAEVWRDFHTFNDLPRHVRARDMVATT